MSKTNDNLQKAFAGESQANRKYLAFAEKADSEGHPQIAKLFRAAAAAETVHAMMHLKKLGAIATTEENLQAAIAGETEEFTKMYPAMIADAEEEDNQSAKTGFSWANKVEAEHAALYREATEKMDNLDVTDYYVCQGCGHTHVGEAPDVCPVCGAPKEMFNKLE